MLRRRLILFYLFILFTGTFAQFGPGRNVQNDDIEQDDEDDSPPKNQKQQLINNVNSQNRLSQGSIDSNGDNRQQNLNQQQNLNPQQNLNQLPVQPAQRSPSWPSRSSSSSSSSTQLAASDECKADVLKYCGKGSQQLISNLKVLQCVDDLDNVSF
jgi:hypothetical protein